MKHFSVAGNTKKALILSVKFHNKPITNRQLFLNNGFDVMEVYSTPGISKHNYYQRLKYHLGGSVAKYLKRRDGKFNDKIIKIVNKYKPDIVYVFQGKQLSAETVQYIKARTFIGLSLIDRVSLFPEIVDSFQFYDFLNTYSKEDAEELQNCGINCEYAPSSTDTNTYYKIPMRKTIDVSFVGAMGASYEDRHELLTKLVKDLPDVKFAIYGDYAPIRKPKQFFEWLTDARLRSCFKNRTITYEQANKLYNSSCICLNLNRSNAGNSWAGRFADIVATKNFQLVTYNESIKEVFDGLVGMYEDYEDLKEQIEYYLSQPALMDDMANACFDKFFNEVVSAPDEQKLWKAYEKKSGK